MSHARATPRLVRARLRQAEALVLRASGMSYDGIARRLGYRSRASACKAVLRGMEVTRDRAAMTLRVVMFMRFQGFLVELERAVTTRDIRRVLTMVEGPLAEAEWDAWIKATYSGRVQAKRNLRG